jgi:hypothetical protein
MNLLELQLLIAASGMASEQVLNRERAMSQNDECGEVPPATPADVHVIPVLQTRPKSRFGRHRKPHGAAQSIRRT